MAADVPHHPGESPRPMRHPPSALRSIARLPLAAGLAALLALGAAVVPPAAGPGAPFLAALDAPVARAAGDLSLATDVRYVLQPADGVVRVTLDATIRNEKPNRVAGGVITRYFYDQVNIGVQPEATGFRATQDGVRVRVDAARKGDYKLVTVDLRGNLFYQESASIRLVFELPGGKPRSSSDVRVGRAFATFLAWAFGDSGTVRIEVPAPFTVDVSGEEMARTAEGTTTVLTASTADPPGWYAWVNARNDAALTHQRLDISGGEKIVVRAWPEDRAWRREVGRILTRGVPALVDRIGLPWPVDGALNVTEIHTPLLEGYAGFYDTAKDEITVSEALDDFTIVHEASHAWFNNDLFGERWITEGLADEYASRVLKGLDVKAPGPGRVSRSAKVAFPLNDWPPPAAIRDPRSGAREQYGYDAAWRVIREVVSDVGVGRMQAVFKAASDGTIAYVGVGPAEASALPHDWRRFLDLTEEVGGATNIDDLLATWALPPGSEADLQARDRARDAYHALVTAGHGWAAPYAVRSALDRWAFDDAEARIAEASGILAERDKTAALAGAQGLEPSDALERAYEGAQGAADLAAAVTLANASASSLDRVAAAGRAVAQPRDWLVDLGLEGVDPDAELASARSAWVSGDLDGAVTHADRASSTLAAAPEAGRQRAVAIGIGIGAALVLLVAVLLLLRRRSRRGASRPPFPPDPPAGPGAPDRYATLPASAAPGAAPGYPPIEDEGAEPS